MADTQAHLERQKQRALLASVYDNLTSERDQFLELEVRTELLQKRLDAVSKNHTRLLEIMQGN